MSKKICGVLIEPRFMTNISTLIQNFHDVLPDVDLIFFCGKTTYLFFKRYYRLNDKVKVISLETDNLTANEYNDLLKTSHFWERLMEYEYTMIIQTDGCLCKNSKFKIEDFYQYDYIGGYTPFKWWWKETKGLHDINDYQCFNGGFSLRRNAAMLDVIKAYPPLASESFSEMQPFEKFGEDLYFVVGLLKLKSQNKRKYNVGLDEFATGFCTHTHYVKNTFCVHKLDDCADTDQLLKFLEYCPEFVSFVDARKLIKKIHENTGV